MIKWWIETLKIFYILVPLDLVLLEDPCQILYLLLKTANAIIQNTYFKMVLGFHFDDFLF